MSGYCPKVSPLINEAAHSLDARLQILLVAGAQCTQPTFLEGHFVEDVDMKLADHGCYTAAVVEGEGGSHLGRKEKVGKAEGEMIAAGEEEIREMLVVVDNFGLFIKLIMCCKHIV